MGLPIFTSFGPPRTLQPPVRMNLENVKWLGLDTAPRNSHDAECVIDVAADEAGYSNLASHVNQNRLEILVPEKAFGDRHLRTEESVAAAAVRNQNPCR